MQEAPLLPSSFRAADGRHTLHAARGERKQLFPLLFPRDGVPADGGGKKSCLGAVQDFSLPIPREPQMMACVLFVWTLSGPVLIRGSRVSF